MFEKKKRLLIIDAHSVLHRAFYALPLLTSRKEGVINAVYGFLLVFFKAIKEFKPDFVVTCFDFPAPTFRHEKYRKYKAKRPPLPEELVSQILKIKKVLSAFSIPIFEKEGFEADDLVGTISRLASGQQVFPEIENIILSGDLDFLQLVDDQTEVCVLRKGVKDTVLYNRNLVKNKYQGLTPEQLSDFKALRGDPSDNIPGVTGIGEKTATQLIKEFGNLENLYRTLTEGSERIKSISPHIIKILLQQREQAFFSRDLATIKRDAPINFKLEESVWGNYNRQKLIEILERFEFYSLIKRLSEI